MRYSVAVSVAPAAEPLTLTEAKLQVKEDDTARDSELEGLIQAAREWTENECRRSWVRRTLQLRLDGFSAEIRLPRGPVASVTSVQYTDQDGNLATAAAALYQVDTASVPARIVLNNGATWPTPKIGALNAVTITYVAGYAPGDGSPTDHAENVPAAVKAALKLHVEAHYDRDPRTFDMLLKVAKSLLAPYVIRDFTLES